MNYNSPLDFLPKFQTEAAAVFPSKKKIGLSNDYYSYKSKGMHTVKDYSYTHPI